MFTTTRTNCCKLIDVLELRRRLRPFSPTTVSIALGAALALGNAAPARADAPSAEATAETRRSEAKAKFDEGVKAYGEGRYADAVALFQSADALAPSAPLSFNVARAFERLDDASSALRWYRDYLRRSPRAGNLAEVQARVAELAAKVAERGVQQLSVLSAPDGATVLVDHQPAGVTPVTLELPPGAHHVQLRLAGYRDERVEIVLDARTPQDVVLDLKRETPSAAEVTRIPARPPARDAGTGVASAAERPFGLAPWLLLGAGGASMAAALGFELSRRAAEDEAERAPQVEYQDHYDAMRGRQTTARVMVGVGGALLVTGGVLLVLNTPREPSPRVALGCRGGACGLSALGTFR